MAEQFANQAVVATTEQAGSRLRPAVHHRFFVAMSVVLLSIVVIGFAPTFYLRALFGTSQLPLGLQTLPTHLHIHGIVLTLWFVVFLAQTSLIASHRTRSHERLGFAGVICASAVFLVTMLVIVRAVSRSPSNGLPSDQLPLVLIGDIRALIVFALFVGAGIWFRRRPDVHKRLMLLASISIVGPALSRLPGALAFFPISVLVPQLALLAALILYDFISGRRVHAATAWGEALYIVMTILSTAVGFSGLGRAFVNALK